LEIKIIQLILSINIKSTSKEVQEFDETERWVIGERIEKDKDGNDVKYLDDTNMILVEETISTHTFPKPREFNATKFEIIRHMLDVIMSPQMNNDIIDSKLGGDKLFENTSFGFKMAFNTLVKYKILKEIII